MRKFLIIMRYVNLRKYQSKYAKRVMFQILLNEMFLDYERR